MVLPYAVVVELSIVHYQLSIAVSMAPDHIPYAPPRLSDNEMRHRAERFFEEMNQRRTVRVFSEAPVPRALIECAIRTAGTAPSGANKQPWKFVVVDDPALKREIREGAEAEEREFYLQRATPEWLADLVPLGTDWQKPFLEVAPYLIVVFRESYRVLSDGSHAKHYYTLESVGIATGLLLTALHHIGLATLTHTPSPMDFLNTILNRPDNERPFVLIPVGYPAEDATVPDIQRKSLEEIMVWNRRLAENNP
jgi:iodotyrosine deiodinase